MTAQEPICRRITTPMLRSNKRYREMSSSGKAIFNQIHCASCHSLEERTMIGPGLRGLFDRVPSKDWLLAFMTKPDSTLNLPNEYSTELRTTDWPQGDKRFHRDRVFDSLYTKEQIYDVLGYIGMKK